MWPVPGVSLSVQGWHASVGAQPVPWCPYGSEKVPQVGLPPQGRACLWLCDLECGALARVGPHCCRWSVSEGAFSLSSLALSSPCVSPSPCLSSVSASGSWAPISVSLPLAVCLCVSPRTGLSHPSPCPLPPPGVSPSLSSLQPEGRTCSRAVVGKATGAPLLSFEASSSPAPHPPSQGPPEPHAQLRQVKGTGLLRCPCSALCWLHTPARESDPGKGKWGL